MPPRSRRTPTGSPGSRPRSKATTTARRAEPAACWFVGGKGGVGKTTCAAALAVASALGGARTLVVSTDPAPSLADGFRRPLGRAPRRIPTLRGTLHALEIDARAALDRWLRPRRAALERIAVRGTWLDAEDVSRLLRLSLPGIDELAALIEIARLAGTGRYDRVVIDTAPTGHTLRMLGMPSTLDALAAAFGEMQARHQAVAAALVGRRAPDAEDAVIAGMAAEADRLAALLRDPARARFSWVTLAEPMAVAETLDAAASLRAAGLTLDDVIVNRLTPAPGRSCGWCRTRRLLEGRAVRSARRALPSIPLLGVAARDAEPRGVAALAAIGREIAARRPPLEGRAARGGPAWRPPAPAAASAVPSAAGDRQLLIFGGKGGAGKTTCAAAEALRLAHRRRDRRVLLISTDPAHSLADVFGVPLSDVPRRLPGGPANLRVREIDAAGQFRAVRDRYAAAIDRWFDRLARGGGGVHVDASQDRRVMQRLMSLAPPGIDELAAVIQVTDAIDTEADVIVMDTAPSGHALRLLEMPGLVQGWTRALMSILLKYQRVGGVSELGPVLLDLSQGLGRLRAMLTDPRRAAFVVVTHAAALPRAESGRLLARLRRMRIHVPLIVANAVGRGRCPRCVRAHQAQRRELRRIHRLADARGAAAAQAPSRLPPPHGVRGLRRWRTDWRLLAGER